MSRLFSTRAWLLRRRKSLAPRAGRVARSGFSRRASAFGRPGAASAKKTSSKPSTGAGRAARPQRAGARPPFFAAPGFSFVDFSCLCFEHFDERFLGNVDRPERFHPFFALFLLFQQLPFARDVAAVTLRRHVLAQGADRFSRDDFPANRRLDGHLILLSGDDLLQLRRQRAPAALA